MSKPRVRVNQRGEVRINDGFVNMAANVGTSRDKAAHGTYVYVPLHQFEAISAYRQSWVAKKAVNIPAEDSTRKWRSWHAETADVSKIEELEKDLRLQQKVMLARVLCRLLGGSALYFTIDGDDPETPLDVDSVGLNDLKAVTVLTRYQLSVTELDTDPDSLTFMHPLYFTLVTPGKSGTVKIHPSRLAIFRGELDPSNTVAWTWGDGILQSTLDTVKQLDSLAANASSLVYEANVDVLSIPRLMELMSEPDGDMKVAIYLKTVAMMKSNNGMLVLDGGDTSVPEGASGGTKYERKGAQFAGLAELWTKFQQNGAGAFDIPATRFFGMAPAGMNATGESDLTNYHESIAAIQSNEIEPAMTVLDECLVRSAMGGYNDNVYFEWRPLHEETSDQKVERGKKTADVLTSLKALGVFPTETLQAIAVSAMTETGALPGLEAAVEEHGLDIEEDDLLAQQAALGRGAPAGPQAGQAAGAPKPRLRVVAGTDTAKQAIKDAAPMSLYVSRKVTNAKAILDHYRKQGATGLLPESELHVTQVYSKTPVDWMQLPTTWSDRIEVGEGGPRLQEVFGMNAPFAQVLLFNADELQWRHRSLIESGCTSDWPDYSPHITLSYEDDLRDMDPWTGPILLGPEMWEEIDEGYKAKLIGDEDMTFAAIIMDKGMKGGAKAKGAKTGGHPSDNQPRLPKGHPDGGQFTSKSGAAGGGDAFKKEAASAAYYELKKAGGYSFLTQSKIKAYAEGTVKPSNALEQKALDTYNKWAKADPAAVKKANEELGGQFSAAIAAQKAAAKAKKAGAAEAVKQAKADLKAIQEKAAVKPAPAPKPAEAKKFEASLDEIGAKYAISTSELKAMMAGEMDSSKFSYSFKQAKKEIEALPGYRAPKPAKQTITAEQKAKLDELETMVTKNAYGMQKETLKKLVSGEWKPDPAKPWQAGAVKSYLHGKDLILNPPPPPKPGELTHVSSKWDDGGPTFYGHMELQTSTATNQFKVVAKAEGTPQQRDAINIYTGGAHKEINKHLRNGGAPKPGDKLRDEFIRQHKLAKDHDFLRGINMDAVNALIKANGGKLSPGAVLVDNGFASMTRSVSTARSFADHSAGGFVIKVKAKAGQAVAPIKHLSSYKHEDEFLLPLGSRMKVTNIDPAARVIFAELL